MGPPANPNLPSQRLSLPQTASSLLAPPTSTSTPSKFNFSAFSNKNAAAASDAPATAKTTRTSALPAITWTLNGALRSDRKGSSRSTPVVVSFKQ
ncbi:hypothetical protein M413DRAFT_441667, partial [Hebeloma cylindrosporum]